MTGGCDVILLPVLVAAVVCVMTVTGRGAAPDLRAWRRVAWVLVTLLLPYFAIPVYWLIKPQRRSPVAPPPRLFGNHPRRRWPDLIPGWSLDLPGACEQANAWAGSESRVSPEPSFYFWLRESGIAERHPACAAILLRTLLGTERRPMFPACPEIGALTRMLEQHLMDGDDLRALREQVRRLCPEALSPDQRASERSVHPALG